MKRKAVLRRLKALSALRSMLRNHRDRLDRRLAARPAAPRAEGFSYGPLFDHLQAELAGVEQDLEAIENTYGGARALLRGLRRERDQALSALYRRQRDVKRLLRGLLGSDDVLVGGTTPKCSVDLALQVERTVDFLRRPERRLPQGIAGVTFDALALAEKLETDLEDLLAASERVIKSVVAASASLSRADKAAAEVDRVLPWVARSLESLCRLVGEHAIADRIRTR